MTRTFGNPLKAAALAAFLATPVASTTFAQGVSVGDLDGYEDYFADETGEMPVTPSAPSAYQAAPATPASRPAPAANYDSGNYDSAIEPATYVGDNEVESAGHVVMDSCGSCGSTDGCGCGMPVMTQRRMTRACQPAKTMNAWLTTEALLWFPQDRRLPALITQSDPGTSPDAAEPSTQVLFGGPLRFNQEERLIDGGLSAGFRVDAGVYLTDNFGIGGRFWSIDDSQTSFDSGVVDGLDRSVGRPFFDSGPVAGPNSALIGFNDGPGGQTDFIGSINANTDLDIYGVEAYARLKMIAGRCFRTELIGGYSNFGIDDSLEVTSVSTVASNDLGATIGNTVGINDNISTENDFQGGQIGFNTMVNRGRWGFSALTKVHLGNMNQRYQAFGARVAGATPADVAAGNFLNSSVIDPNGAEGGLLNLGTGNVVFERDVFSFAPEANIKLAYRFRPNVSLSVGYSFLYWDRVLMVEDNVSTVFNSETTQLLVPAVDGVPAPPLHPRDRGFWVQGVDLGAVIQF